MRRYCFSLRWKMCLQAFIGSNHLAVDGHYGAGLSSGANASAFRSLPAHGQIGDIPTSEGQIYR